VAASVHADMPHTAEPVTLNRNPMHHSRGRQLSLDGLRLIAMQQAIREASS